MDKPAELSGALIFALIMISLVIMCIISLCVAKAQQGKGAQKYGPHTDVPGKHSRNFVRNVQPYESKQVEINFGNEKRKTPVHEFVNEQAFKPNYEFSQPKKSSTPPPKYSDKSTLEYEKTRKKRPSGRPSGQSNNRRSDQSNGRVSKSNRDSKPRSKTSKSRSPGGGRSSPKGHQVTI